MSSILIIDGHDEQASGRFETDIRPGLPQDTEIEVVQGAVAARRRLTETDPPIVVVEHLVVEPVKLELPPMDPAEVLERLNRGEKVTISPTGLSGATINEVIQPAYALLPEFIKRCPKAGFIIVSHGKGIGVGKDLPKYKAFPEVLGIFGWISSKGTAGRILELIRSRLGGKPRR